MSARYICSGCGAKFHEEDSFVQHCQRSTECADRVCANYGHVWRRIDGDSAVFCEVCGITRESDTRAEKDA